MCASSCCVDASAEACSARRRRQPSSAVRPSVERGGDTQDAKERTSAPFRSEPPSLLELPPSGCGGGALPASSYGEKASLEELRRMVDEAVGAAVEETRYTKTTVVRVDVDQETGWVSVDSEEREAPPFTPPLPAAEGGDVLASRKAPPLHRRRRFLVPSSSVRRTPPLRRGGGGKENSCARSLCFSAPPPSPLLVSLGSKPSSLSSSCAPPLPVPLLRRERTSPPKARPSARRPRVAAFLSSPSAALAPLTLLHSNSSSFPHASALSFLPDYASLLLPLPPLSPFLFSFLLSSAYRAATACACPRRVRAFLLNGSSLPLSGFREYALSRFAPFPLVAEEVVVVSGSSLLEVVIANAAAERSEAFVNSVRCPKGTHISLVARQVCSILTLSARERGERVAEKDAVLPDELFSRAGVILSVHVPSPRFGEDGSLLTPPSQFGFAWWPSRSFVTSLSLSNLVSPLPVL